MLTLCTQANMTNPPFVHSVSYGDVESSLDLSFMERINQEFQIVCRMSQHGRVADVGLQVGTRGISIMFASGDSGAACENKTFAPK